ncbi:MAG: PAS domain S-box protein [Desulfobacterales bacterium]|jgi:PAS domain S-box-containing protein
MKSRSTQKSIDDFQGSFTDFIDRVPFGVYRSSIEGMLTFGNRALARIFGFQSVDEMRCFPLVRLYRSKMDRGDLINELIRSGFVEDRPIEFQRLDGSRIWCSVTAQAVRDTDGNMTHMDGILRDITPEKEPRKALAHLVDFVPSRREFSFSLDDGGLIQRIDPEGAEIFGYDAAEMVGNPLSAYIAPKHRQMFSGFFADVLKQNASEGILIFNDREGKARHLMVHARNADREGEPGRVCGVGRDVTRIVENQQERLDQERLQGVIEMAGGVAHRLNQPLTLIANLVNEIVADTPPEDPRTEKLARVQSQVQRLIEITKKIGKIRKYKLMDYVAGVRIVDIDQAS